MRVTGHAADERRERNSSMSASVPMCGSSDLAFCHGRDVRGWCVEVFVEFVVLSDVVIYRLERLDFTTLGCGSHLIAV